MYVCMYVSMYVYMYVCMYVCMHAYIYCNLAARRTASNLIKYDVFICRQRLYVQQACGCCEYHKNVSLQYCSF